MYSYPEQLLGQSYPQAPGMSEQALSDYLRTLWEQHVYWTRLVISGIAFGSPDAQFSTMRLLRNPKDFEAVFRIFYGERLAEKFADLFTSHLTIAAELVKAAKAGDSAAAGDAERRWYANADQIAAFLAGINPYWTKSEWQKMLYDHLAMTKAEAVDFISGKYADSVGEFDTIEHEALSMADRMTRGIVQQFYSYFG